MKSNNKLTILVLTTFFCVVTGQTPDLVFSSFNVDNPPSIYYEEVDPWITVDLENSQYGLTFTRSGANGIFTPRAMYWDESDSYWNAEDITPSGEVVEARYFQLSGDIEILSLRYSNDFNNLPDSNQTGYLQSGTWVVYKRQGGSGNWTIEKEAGAFSHVAYQDVGNNNQDILFSKIFTEINSSVLRYYKRNSNGTYNPSNGMQIVSNPNLFLGASFDLTIGPNSTPYFCYIINGNLKVKPSGGSEYAISSLTIDYNNPWTQKLNKIPSPSIAYNSNSDILMIVFSDLDNDSNLWSLFYSIWDGSTSQWSNPQRVYNNSEQTAYPCLTADVNSDDFFLSFYSFDDSQQTNHVYLSILGYSAAEGNFGNSPIEIDVGALENDGGITYYGRPIHSVVLPYESPTTLLVASVSFESSSNTDVKLYEITFPNNEFYTFWNIVVDEDAGGSLELSNNSTGSTETFVSGSSRTLSTQVEYTIETLPRRFDNYNYQGTVNDYQHNHWGTEDGEYLLSMNFYPSHFESEKSAIYLELSGINLNSDPANIGFQFHDPWYYDPTTQTQPDDFRPITPGQYQVFLNQNENFYDNIPIYRLRAPQVYVTQSNIYAFKVWRAFHSDGTTYDNDGSWAELIDSTNYQNCPVVFKQAGAVVKAVYEAVNQIAYYVLTIPANESLTIPSGATITFATGFVLDVHGDLAINGTGDQRITLRMSSPPQGPIESFGIHIHNDCAHFTMEYTTLDYGTLEFRNDEPQTYAVHRWINHCVFNSNFTVLNDWANPSLPLDLRFINNTIWSNAPDPSVLILNHDYPIIKNNIFVNADIAVNCVMGSGGFTYNQIYNSTVENYTPDPNYNFFTAPMLKDPSQGDFTLQEDSPCIDAGYPDTPLDPDSTIADMGAFYYDAVPATPSGFNVTVNGQHHPVLTWNGNTEPDLDGYNVYRRLGSGMYALWNTVDENTTTIIDLEVSVSGNPFDPRVCYYVRAVDWIGQESMSTPSKCKNYRGIGKELVASLPEEYALHNNYPNPFNPVTTIPFDLPEPGLVTLTIYDLMGREVRTLVQGPVPAGFQQEQWEGKDNHGNPLPSGMYLVKLLARSQKSNKAYTQTRKLVLLK